MLYINSELGMCQAIARTTVENARYASIPMASDGTTVFDLQRCGTTNRTNTIQYTCLLSDSTDVTTVGTTHIHCTGYVELQLVHPLAGAGWSVLPCVAPYDGLTCTNPPTRSVVSMALLTGNSTTL